MKGKIIFVLVLALLLSTAIVITAYAETQNVTINGRVNAKIVMTVDTSTISFVDMDPDTTQTLNNVLTVNVRSNKTYAYEVTAPANWTGGSTPPITRMAFNRTAWTTFAGGANDVVGNAAKTNNAGTNWTYSLALKWDYADDPAAYSALLVPTAVQNP